MPTPDGRSWLTSRQIGLQMAQHFIREFEGEAWFDAEIPFVMDVDMDAETLSITPESPFPDTCMLGQPNIKMRFWDAMRAAFIGTGYTTEFKLCRLWEKLKNRIMANEVSQIEDVKTLIVQFYNKDVLDTLDEDGELKA